MAPRTAVGGALAIGGRDLQTADPTQRIESKDIGESMTLLYLALLVAGVFFLIILRRSLVYIPNNRVGILEKLISGRGSVKSGLIALQGEAGFQPELLRGGWHFLKPFQYRVHRMPLVTIPQGEIGYIF